ncbi:hypothetical protein GGS23DRAFT_574832 [Durotheca rogersii]|uniref:uncharacterized protein n=1 Tax=Durotheca rogersii TaxID=419775 RepID=UPI00221E914E|nr:uncharacterized protein GGS23DRAFT_574832 [Durotheca rogersii]KAI5861768.1 hypothetical protein GGS23DRAFT_574832 [Durotheca rogersii]
MTASTIRQPDAQQVLGPLLPTLPAAALSTEPTDKVLPLLSPILRQRVQLLSSSSQEPWIRLLCYEPAKVARLVEIAQSDRLHPHPVSGEVEVDWDYDADTRYRRVDEETLQALVVLRDMNLAFRLIYCTGDPADDGWKVGEVSVAEKPSPFSSFGGVSSINEAERQFHESKARGKLTTRTHAPAGDRSFLREQEEEDDDDDDYWARYDATPARTPAVKRSPAPEFTYGNRTTAEDDYYAQYDDVQPAMDNHDPDEEANLDIAPPLGLAARPSNPAASGSEEEDGELNETQGAWTLAEPPRSPSTHSRRNEDDPLLIHPRPASSASSNASVEKLEAAAAKQELNDFGVQQHVSRSIKSLYMLSRASGIDREEFERLVKTELDTLALMED